MVWDSRRRWNFRGSQPPDPKSRMHFSLRTSQSGVSSLQKTRLQGLGMRSHGTCERAIYPLLCPRKYRSQNEIAPLTWDAFSQRGADPTHEVSEMSCISISKFRLAVSSDCVMYASSEVLLRDNFPLKCFLRDMARVMQSN